MRQIDRTGEIYTTNEGYKIHIVEYFNASDCTIKFNDNKSTTRKNISYNSIKKGEVKNPNHRSLYGQGYLGQGKYNSTTYVKIYDAWHGMFSRCYNEKIQVKHPTYKGCSVDKRWHCLQDFGVWYENNYKEGFELDKDIINKSNKIYSPDKCDFVPKEINTILLRNQARRGNYPLGVSKRGNKFRVRCNINGKNTNFGTFTTIEEAFTTYRNIKKEEIKSLANKWKPYIKPRVYQALMNYKVEITD